MRSHLYGRRFKALWGIAYLFRTGTSTAFRVQFVHESRHCFGKILKGLPLTKVFDISHRTREICIPHDAVGILRVAIIGSQVPVNPYGKTILLIVPSA
jgi:hypothetical protein